MLTAWDPKLVEKYDTILFDCDGVLWRGAEMIPGASETLKQLRKLNKTVLFVTNNSTKSRKSYGKKFKALNIQASTEEIFPASYAGVAYLEKHLPKNKRVFVIGEQGIMDELDIVGIPYVHMSEIFPRGHEYACPEKMANFELPSDIGAVIVGWTAKFDWCAGTFAARCVAEENAFIIFTNPDHLTPYSANVSLPANGAVMGFFKVCLGLENPIVTGKPNPFFFDVIKSKIDIDPKRCLMVGDTIDTDILFGKSCGMDTLLTLTGNTTSISNLENCDIKPNYYISSIARLMNNSPIRSRL